MFYYVVQTLCQDYVSRTVYQTVLLPGTLHFVIMVNKCCAAGCKSRYVGHSPSDARITFTHFLRMKQYTQSGSIPFPGWILYLQNTLGCAHSISERLTSSRSTATPIRHVARNSLPASSSWDISRRTWCRRFLLMYHPTRPCLPLHLVHLLLQHVQPVIDRRNSPRVLVITWKYLITSWNFQDMSRNRCKITY